MSKKGSKTMAPARELRRFTINVLGGRSPMRDRPQSFTKEQALQGYPFFAFYKIEINLPFHKQLSCHHPRLIKRLIKDWGSGGLSALRCSSGDFYELLKSGRASIGHVFAEVYSLILDYVTTKFDKFWRVPFAERVRLVEEESSQTRSVYLINLFFGQELPAEFGGLESITMGYINALLEGRRFEIFKILDGYVEYRTKRRHRRLRWWLRILRLFGRRRK